MSKDNEQEKPEREPGTLAPGETHPAAYRALEWVRGLNALELAIWQESFSSCAISGNRLAEVCAETLRRVVHGEPVSDRYILGVAWMMRYNTSHGAPD